MNTTHSNYKIKIFTSPFFLFFQIFLLMLFIGIFDYISILAFDFMKIQKLPNTMFSYEELFFLGSLFIQFVLVIYLFLQWGSDYFYFDNDKLFHKTGIIFKKIASYDIARIDNIAFKQKIIGRIFNYGNVTLFFGNQVFTLKHINDPYEFTKLIESNREKYMQ